jgi:hypothetical protein
MPQRQHSRPGSEDEPLCPKCLSAFMDRVNLKLGFRALSRNIFQCSKCARVEIVVEGGGKPYGKIHPPGKPESTLAEVQDEATRKLVLKLLAEEEAKDFAPPKERK